MQVIYVIGGIGSGKSELMKLFRDKDIPTLDLDVVGHKVLLDKVVKDQLVLYFGSDILNIDKTINRKKLAQKAFSSAEATQVLNNATTKAINAYEQQWCNLQEKQGQKYCAIEVSVYDGPSGRFPRKADCTIVVIASQSVREKRLVKRGMSLQDARARISRQVNDEQRIKWADVVLENNKDIKSFSDAFSDWFCEYKKAQSDNKA